MTPLEALWARLADERAVVGVAGLGHVGLRRTRELARAGFRTTGIARRHHGARLSPRPRRGRRALLLGVSLERSVSDIRTSSALKLLELPGARGLDVAYHDPLAPDHATRDARLDHTGIVRL